MNLKTQAGERLPYLLQKLKAPRVLERLDETAERARTEQWPYEQFLEALLEAEAFAREASGARQRVRAAQFPQRKTLEDFDWQAQPAAEELARSYTRSHERSTRMTPVARSTSAHRSAASSPRRRPP